MNESTANPWQAFNQLREEDLALMTNIAGFNDWLRALLCTLARRGVALRQNNSDRAQQILQILSPLPYYKAGQFLFDLMEWEDFMLDGPEPALLPTALDAEALNRLTGWLDRLRMSLDGGFEAGATSHNEIDGMGPGAEQDLPPIEPGFYLYQDVVLGVVDSLLTA